MWGQFDCELLMFYLYFCWSEGCEGMFISRPPATNITPYWINFTYYKGFGICSSVNQAWGTQDVTHLTFQIKWIERKNVSVSCGTHCGSADKDRSTTYRNINAVRGRGKTPQTRLDWQVKPQSRGITATYGDKREHFEYYHRNSASTSVALCHSKLPVHDVGQERTRVHTRDGLSITSHPAGPFWGLLSCTVRGGGWGWRWGRGGGGRSEREEARGHEVLLFRPPVLLSGNSPGHMGAHGAVCAGGRPDKPHRRHIFLCVRVFVGCMKSRLALECTPVFVRPWLSWVFVICAPSGVTYCALPQLSLKNIESGMKME